MRIIKFLAYLLLLTALLQFCLGRWGVSPLELLDLRAGLLLLAGLLLSLVSHGPGRIAQAVAQAFGRPGSARQLAASQRIVAGMSTYVLLTSLLGLLLDGVQILGTRVEPAAMGHALAVALIGLVYALLLRLLLFGPLEAQLARQALDHHQFNEASET